MIPDRSPEKRRKSAFWDRDFPYAALITLLCLFFFHEVLLNPSKMLYYLRSDLCRFLVPKVTFIVDSFYSEGVFPLWEPFVYSGKPPLGVPQLGLFYPFFIFVILFSTTCAYGYLFAVHYIIGGLGMYLYVKEISGERRQAFLSSIVFIFCGYMSARVLIGQYWHISSMSWIPFIFFFSERVIKKRSFLAGVLLAGALAMQFLAGHTQYFFYTAFVLFPYIIYRLLGELRSAGLSRCAWAALILLFSGAIFLLLSGVQMLPSLEYGRYVYRANMYDFEIASGFSLMPGDLPTLIFPNIKGSAVDFSYWGLFNFWEVCAYMGLLPLMLGSCSILLCRDRYNTFFILLLLFSILFSMGSTVPLFSLLYHRLPGFNLFRCPSRMLVIYSFSFALVSGYGFSVICGGRRTGVRRLLVLFLLLFVSLLSAIGAFVVFREQAVNAGKGVVAIIFNLDPHGAHTHSLSEWQELVPGYYDRIRESLVSPWQCANLAIASSVCILLLWKRLKAGTALFVVCTAILIDLWSLGMPMIMVKSPGEVYRAGPAMRFLKGEKGLFRVHDRGAVAPIEVTEPGGIFRIEGFESIFLKYYIQYLTCLKCDEKRWLGIEDADFEMRNYLKISGIDFDSIAGLDDNLNLLNLLNVKYVITAVPLSRPGMDLVYSGERVQTDDNTLEKSVVPVLIYSNSNRLPRAFVVREAVLARDDIESLRMLKTHDPRKVAVLSSPSGRMKNPGEYREAEVVAYSPNRIEVAVDLDEGGFLVLSEVWYPGWRAVDNCGEELPVLRINHCLRGVYLEPGMHRVAFEYRPASFITGLRLSIIGVVLFCLFLVLSLVHCGRRSR